MNVQPPITPALAATIPPSSIDTSPDSILASFDSFYALVPDTKYADRYIRVRYAARAGLIHLPHRAIYPVKRLRTSSSHRVRP